MKKSKKSWTSWDGWTEEDKKAFRKNLTKAFIIVYVIPMWVRTFYREYKLVKGVK